MGIWYSRFQSDYAQCIIVAFWEYMEMQEGHMLDIRASLRIVKLGSLVWTWVSQ